MSKDYDGNAEQLKMIAEEIGRTIVKNLEKEGEVVMPHQSSEFQNWLDRRIGEKLRLWAFGLVAAYAIPALILAYTFGRLTDQIEASVSDKDDIAGQMAIAELWMLEQENLNADLVEWAEEREVEPFRLRNGGSGVIDRRSGVPAARRFYQYRQENGR